MDVFASGHPQQEERHEANNSKSYSTHSPVVCTLLSELLARKTGPVPSNSGEVGEEGTKKTGVPSVLVLIDKTENVFSPVKKN